MRKWHRGLLVLCVLLLSFPITVAQAQPLGARARFFPETGHNVRAEFMKFFNNHGGLYNFGYPITDEYEENGKIVQYFERNRFEYHPDLAGTEYEVLLGLLGEETTQGREFPKDKLMSIDDPAWYFEETGRLIDPVFRNHWSGHGGLPMFGYPISGVVQETSVVDGKVYAVQYFERARFEYHPENVGTEYEVLLGLLGIERLKQLGMEPVTAGQTRTQSSRGGERESWERNTVGIPSLEEEMLAIINEDRAKAGVHPLRMDPAITEVARAHMREMFDNNNYSHSGLDGSGPVDRMKRAGINVRFGGECFWGVSNSDRHQGLRDIEAAMMAEPLRPGLFNHHYMIVNTNSTRIGIAVGISPNGWLWVVQDYADN